MGWDIFWAVLIVILAMVILKDIFLVLIFALAVAVVIWALRAYSRRV